MRYFFLAYLLFMQEAFSITPQASNEKAVLKKSVENAIGGLEEAKSSGTPEKDCPVVKKSSDALPTLSSSVSKIVSEFKCDFGATVENCLKLLQSKLSPSEFKEYQNYASAYLEKLPKESIEKLRKIQLSTKYGDAINQSAFLTNSSACLGCLALAGVGLFGVFAVMATVNAPVKKPTVNKAELERVYRQEGDQLDREAGFIPGNPVYKELDGNCLNPRNLKRIADRYCEGIDYEHTRMNMPDQDAANGHPSR